MDYYCYHSMNESQFLKPPSNLSTVLLFIDCVYILNEIYLHMPPSLSIVKGFT